MTHFGRLILGHQCDRLVTETGLYLSHRRRDTHRVNETWSVQKGVEALAKAHGTVMRYKQ